MQSTSKLPKGIEITPQEYEQLLVKSEPTEEEIRAQKEAQLSQLIRELYPEEFSDEK